MKHPLVSRVHEIAAHAKRRRFPGTGVLVVGPGCFVAASMIETLSGRSAYRVDLNAVLRKYVAQTAKNLDLAFAEAERRKAILVFDEADALFVDRSEAQDGDSCSGSVTFRALAARIEHFRGVVVLAASRAAIDPSSRHDLAYVIDLPNLEAATDVEIARENIQAIGVIYFAWMLEQAGVFKVVDRLAELFASGLLPLGNGNAGELLHLLWREGGLRLSEGDRRNVYRRTLGAPEGDASVTPNRAFGELWIRFVTAVSSAAAHERALEAGRDLAVDLTLHGYGMAAYAARELQAQMRDAQAVLSDPEVRSAFGARDMWQVVERVASQHFGGAPNIPRFAAMAASGARIFEWLANHAATLLNASGSITDAGLVDDCERWLAASRLTDALDPSYAPTGNDTRATVPPPSR